MFFFLLSPSLSTAATGVQTAGLLDALFMYTGALGCVPIFKPLNEDQRQVLKYTHQDRRSEVLGAPVGWNVALWSPPAQSVSLVVYKSVDSDAVEREVAMTQDEKGVWRAELEGEHWTHKSYTYRITAYHPATQKVEVMTCPDPYSRCACADSKRTFLADPLTDASMKPEGWHEDRVHEVEGRVMRDPSDIVLYELHVRDFSACDETVPEELRGTNGLYMYMHIYQRDLAVRADKHIKSSTLSCSLNTGTYAAFALDSSAGVDHLKAIAQSGITHIHLLPFNDFGSVPERRSDRSPDLTREDIAKQMPHGRIDPTSEEPSKLVWANADRDSFNWGYDPVLFFAPEGSYSTDPDSPQRRIVETRRMVQAMHRMGLRCVVDVVFNHTFHAGPSHPLSVLDKVR